MESYNASKPRRKIHVLQSNKDAWDTSISHFIHASDTPLTLGVCFLFKAVIASARLTRKQYKPPKRNIVGGPLLENIYEHVKGNNDTQLQKDFPMYSMTEMGYGETIVIIQMFNVLASKYGTSPVVLKVHEWSRNLERGG